MSWHCSCGAKNYEFVEACHLCETTRPRCEHRVDRYGRWEACGEPAVAIRTRTRHGHQRRGSWLVCELHAARAPRWSLQLLNRRRGPSTTG